MLNIVDYHAIAMIFGWSLTGVAVSAVHYLRCSWPDKKFLSHRIWFHIHRTANIVALLAIGCGLALILLEKQAWTGPWFGRSSQENNSGAKWHSLVGAFAIVLVLVQPLNALISSRCGPFTHPASIWVHRKLGKLACTAAAITLLIGICIFRKHFADVTLAITAFVAFFVALLILAIGRHMEEWQQVQKGAVGHEMVNYLETGHIPGVPDANERKLRGSLPPSEKFLRRQLFFFVLKSGACLMAAFALILNILFH